MTRAFSAGGKYVSIEYATMNTLEQLHLGFNMMSLVWPGEALEEWRYGSLPFFMLNISLTAFMTNLIHIYHAS